MPLGADGRAMEIRLSDVVAQREIALARARERFTAGKPDEARQLLEQGELNSAIILLESQLSSSQGHAEYSTFGRGISHTIGDADGSSN